MPVVIVEVVIAGSKRPPPGATIRVEVRDTSLADAPSRTLAVADGEVRGRAGTWLETVELHVAESAPRSTVWALVDVDGDGRTSKGDFVTVASHPVPRGDEARVTVTVKAV